MPRCSKLSPPLQISLPKVACTFLPSQSNLALPYLITLIIFSEQYQSWRSSLCNLPQSPISCCFLPLSTRSLSSAHRHSAQCPNAQHDRPIQSCGRSTPFNLTRYHVQPPSGEVSTHIMALLIFAVSSGAPDNYRVNSLIYKLNNDHTNHFTRNMNHERLS
jgi:hypothetical protein